MFSLLDQFLLHLYLVSYVVNRTKYCCLLCDGSKQTITPVRVDENGHPPQYGEIL